MRGETFFQSQKINPVPFASAYWIIYLGVDSFPFFDDRDLLLIEKRGRS